jgi:asparagine N-glycosylation enzyme membrane subunit Stt3
MAIVRIVLLVLLVVCFVATLGAVFSAQTGALEKVVLAAIALLIALAVPRVQRLGRAAPG